jgi:PAS domain S-box-containing protein
MSGPERLPPTAAPFASGIASEVVDLLQQAVIVTDLDGVVGFMNPFAERLYGWGSGEAVGRNILEVNVPDVSREQALEIMATLRAGGSWTGEFPVRRRDGSSFMAAVTDTPVRDEQGVLRAIIGVSSDVTERRHAEEALFAGQARFRTLADEAPVGIFETDGEGRIVYLNQAGQRILGMSLAAARGAHWQDGIHPEDRERIRREWLAAIAAGRVFASEYRLRGTNGGSTLVQGYAKALRDRGGRITGYMGVSIDITRARALQSQLAVASRLAAIGTLVAGAAREIDDPLSVSLTDQGLALDVARHSLGLLQGDAPIDRATEIRVIQALIDALQDAREGGRRIARIVKGLALLAGTAPGRIQVRLGDIVNQALHWLPAAVTEEATIKVERVDVRDVNASAGQIEQVVVNLVSNAARASPAGARGPVLVRIGPGGPGMARLEVVDRGAGIEPAILERIFEPFFTTRTSGEGVGLGLAVSQAIVTSHGGTLTVESVVGRGSTFRVELPVAV